MGGFHRAGTGKNKKVIEISPLQAFWPERAKEWKFKKFISLVRNGLFQILFFVKKVWQKVAIGKFATFLTPFQTSSTKICLQVKSSHFVLNLKMPKKVKVGIKWSNCQKMWNTTWSKGAKLQKVSHVHVQICQKKWNVETWLEKFL